MRKSLVRLAVLGMALATPAMAIVPARGAAPPQGAESRPAKVPPKVLAKGPSFDEVWKLRPAADTDGTPESIPTFRIKPLKPVDELRAEAGRARPPHEKGAFRAPDLVELGVTDPTIKRDIRYATTNNFVGTAFYTQARAFLQRPAAEAVVRVQARLRARGFGLLIHDAYRPWAVTKMFWDATPEAQRGFVANPAKGSRHNRGCAVDLSLYDLKTGTPIVMPSGYDEFSDRASPTFPGGSALARWHRDLLRAAMEAEGFWVNDNEWWHFDHQDFEHYPILDVPFEKLGQTR